VHHIIQLFIHRLLKSASVQEMTQKKDKNRGRFSRYLLPLLPVLVSIIVYYIPSLTDDLQFNRKEMFSYKIYLFITCHFTHWNFRHMLVDTFILLVFSYLCILFSFEKKYSSIQYLVYLLVPSIVTTIAVLIFNPEIKFYRGLSAVDWALYGILMVQLYFSKHWFWKTGAAIMLIIFPIKMILQIVTGHSMFVPDMGAGIVNVPIAHIAGATSGMACALIYHFFSHR
jgi:hypothetical protein